MALVRAVADKKGARGLGAEQQVRLAAGHGAPVESALLQLAHGVHHQLVLAFGAEGLEAQAGVQGAAHPGGGKLAVGDHGARSQRGSARRWLQLLRGLRTAAATASRGASPEAKSPALGLRLLWSPRRGGGQQWLALRPDVGSREVYKGAPRACAPSGFAAPRADEAHSWANQAKDLGEGPRRRAGPGRGRPGARRDSGRKSRRV